MNDKKLLMIVDDDADDREFFCEAVTKLNSPAECITALNGEDALKILRYGIERLPNFIFLDLNMPKMDGRTCLVELKKDLKLKHIPVIIFSTSSDQRDRNVTHGLGAAYFLSKPTDFLTLQNEIDFVMSKNWQLHEKVKQ